MADAPQIPQAVLDAQNKAFGSQQPEQSPQPDIPPAVMAAQNGAIRAQVPEPAAPAIPDGVMKAQQQVTGVTEPAPVASEEPESLLKRSGRRAGQELLSTPGAVPGLYGLAGAAIDRYVNGVPWDEAMLSEEGRELVKAATDDSNPEAQAAAQQQLRDNPQAILRTGLQSAAEWYNWGGEVTGVTDNPDGSVPLDEEVGGIIGSSLLLLPANIVSKPAAAINKISNRAARLALKTGLHGVEAVTPGTIGAGKYGSNIAINAGLQTALNDVARGLTGQQTLAGQVTGMDFTEAEAEEAAAGMPLSDSGEAAATAAGVGGLAAAALGGGAALNRIVRQTTDTVTSSGGERLGQMPVRDSAGNAIRDVVQDVQSSVSDTSNTLLEGLRRTGISEQAVDRFDDFLRANAGSATNVASDRFKMTGLVDADGDIRTKVPPVELFRAYDKMDGQMQGKFDMYVEAKDELTRRARGVRSLDHLSDRELNRRIQANGTPEVQKMAEAYFDIGRKMSDYRLKHRTINTQQHQAESVNYMPNIEAEPPRAGLAGFLDRRARNQRSSLSSDIAAFEKQAAGGIAEKVPPMDAMKRYIDVQMREVGQNRVRRAYLKQLSGRKVTDFAQGRRLVTTRGNQGGTPVRVMDDGVEKTYYVGDPRIAHALQFNPHAVAGFGLNTTRRWFQQTTTGVANPLFAPVSLAYDAFAGMLGGRTNRVVTGMMDDAMARAGFSERMRDFMAVLRPLDTLTVVGEGLVTGVTGRYKEQVAIQMARRAAQQGTPISDAAAEAAAKQFVESKYGAMQMQGYSANMMVDGLGDTTQGAIDKIMQNMSNSVKRTLAARVYISGMDVIRDAYRMGMYSRNVAHQRWLNKQAGNPPDLTKAQNRKIVNHVREVGVDPTKRGASDTVNKITSAVPYGNITLQSANHLMRNIMVNPGARAAAISLVTMAWGMRESMSPEAREWYENRVPDYRRGTSLTFTWQPDDEEFDPQKHMYHLPIGPEMGLIVHGITEGLHAWLGETETGDPTAGARLRAALFDMLVPGVPPMVQGATAAMTGGGTFDAEAMMRGDSAIRQPKIEGGVPEMRGVGMNDGWVTDRIYGMVTSMFGAFGRTLMDAAEVLDTEMAAPDGEFSDGMKDALEVVAFNTVGGGQRVGTLWSDKTRELPRGTPLSNKAYEIRNFGDQAVQFARDLVPNFSEGPRDADIRYDEAITLLPNHLSDPALQQQAMQLRAIFGNPQIKHAMRDAGQLRKSYFRTDSNTDVGLEAKNRALQDINNEMHERFEQVAQSFGTFEKGMQARWGPNWSIEAFLDAASKDIYSQ